MSTNDKTTLTNFLTGGDLFFHRLRLLLSNGGRLFGVGCAVLSVTFFILVQVFVTKYEWHVFWKSSLASFWTIFGRPKMHLNFIRPDGQKVDGVTSAAILKFVRDTPELALDVAKVAGFGTISLAVAGAVVFGLALYYIRYGKEAQDDEFLRGQKECEPEQLDKLIRESIEIENKEIEDQNKEIETKNNKISDPGKRLTLMSPRKMSPIKIGDVRFSLEMLFQNILILGGMGSGKSVIINSIIGQYRAWGKKLIIYDIKGEFTSLWYRDGVDKILSVVDARSALWTIFNDLREVTDIAKLSTFFVPKPKKAEDDIWGDLARMLLEDLITIVRKNGGTMKDVADIITQYSLDDLSKLLKDNNARSAGSINPENPKGAESVRLTLTGQPAIRFFEFFDDTTADFSLRDFIRQNDDACLFLNSSEIHHEACRPFISAWLQLAILEAMSMGPSSDVRIAVILDELDSLGKMDLDPLFTRARSYGVATTIGIQNKSQPDDTFGEDKTRTYFSNWQNKFIMRCPESESAKYLSDTLGKEDIKEGQTSLSFGVESSRDGVSLSQKRGEIAIVTDTDIMKLPKYVGYLKVAGDFPIAKIRHRYTPILQIAEAMVRRDGLDLKEVIPPSVSALAAHAALVNALNTAVPLPDDDVSEAEAELEQADPAHHSSKAAEISQNEIPVSLDEINHVPAAESEGHGFY